MIIQTRRLELIPLTLHQLKLWIEDMHALEKELNCTYQGEPMVGLFLNIAKGQLEATEKDKAHYFWHSFWLLLRKTDRTVIGAADFKDVPNANGEVEIGYGIGKAFEHNGYMTEAVESMCKWALRQKNVLNIIAETDIDNQASQNILERCGFIKYKEEETIWWRL